MDLGKIGAWWSGPWDGDGGSFQAATELEAAGFGTLWSSSRLEPGLSGKFEGLLAATSHVCVASGIARISPDSAGGVAAVVARQETAHPGRFLLGLGVGGDNNTSPVSRMRDYLDALDTLDPGVRADRRVLAALGPRMLTLAAERAAGAHTYFVPVAHTARARQILGADAVLAVEVTAVLEPDSYRARERARAFTSFFLSRDGYARNLRQLGYGDDMLTPGGSDRLVDALIAWGDAAAIASRVREHLDAGATHVCVQMLPTDGEACPVDDYKALARRLLASS